MKMQSTMLSLSLSLLSISQTAHLQAQPTLTTYVTEWSGYDSPSGGYPSYPFDNSYPGTWHSTTRVANPDMVAKANKSDVLSYAFLQVWNPNTAVSKQYNVPATWAGLLHFDDLWANLPSQVATEYPAWKAFSSGLPTGSCAALQHDGNGNLQLMDYNTLDVGQLNNFGAFTAMNAGNARKVISIGGANTVQNESVSTASFEAIFANQTQFIASLKSWLTALKQMDSHFNGVDFDFEPPINADGAQLPPDANTKSDYKNLFNVVVAARQALGQDAYISVTITPNEDYLEAINSSVGTDSAQGWFAQIAPYVNSINVMTYDLHGAWSNQSDPGAISHAMLEHPNFLKHTYEVNYAAKEIVQKVLAYGLPANKLSIGMASYGRGFANVDPGTNPTYPGFDQPWNGSSTFSGQYTNQDGLLPYKSVAAILQADPSYKTYDVTQDSKVIASYLYSPVAKQLVGYESPALVDSLSQFIKSNNLQGAILWSMDTDAADNGSQGESLISRYRQNH